MKKCFASLVGNLVDGQQDSQAKVYYLEGLKKRALDRISQFAKMENQCGSLNRRANEFRKNSNSYVKICYKQWRHQFIQI